MDIYNPLPEKHSKNAVALLTDGANTLRALIDFCIAPAPLERNLPSDNSAVNAANLRFFYTAQRDMI